MGFTACFVLCVVVPALVEAATFFQISDVHVDAQYQTGTDPIHRCVNFTSSPAKAGKWGNYLCDSAVVMFQSALEAMKAVDPNPQFVLFTGDSVPHWLDYTSCEFYTQEMVKTGMEMVLDMTHAVFPNTPILPVLGNHDNFLSDQIGAAPGSTPWLDWVASIWAPWLTADALATVRLGGFFTQLISPGLRLVSFNSVYCDTSNVYAALNQTDDYAGQFIWLNQTLAAARAAGEKVFMAGHIVFTDYTTDGRERYYAMAAGYSDVIVAHFYGDRHTDEFRIIRSPQNNNVAVGVMYVMPSIVPHDELNPAFRHYTYDATSGAIQDAVTYYTDLANGTQPSLIWQVEYSPLTEYNMKDLSPASWLDFYNRMKYNATLWTRFYQHYRSNHVLPCNVECRNGILWDVSTEKIEQSLPRGRMNFPPATLLPTAITTDAPPARTAAAGAVENRLFAAAENGTLCDVCLAAMDIVQYSFTHNVPQAEVINLITRLCPIQKHVPQDVCWCFCHLYGPASLPVISMEENPHRVCYFTRMCT